MKIVALVVCAANVGVGIVTANIPSVCGWLVACICIWIGNAIDEDY